LFPSLPTRRSSDLLVRQIANQYSRLVFDQAYQAYCTPERDVRNEQFFTGHSINVTVPNGPRAERREIRSGAGFRQGKRRETLAAGQQRKILRLLFRRSTRAYRIHSTNAAVQGSESGDRGFDHRHAREKRGEGAKRSPAVA